MVAQNLALPPASHQSVVQHHIQVAARQGEQTLVVEGVVPHILAVEVLGSLGSGVVLQDTVVVQLAVPTPVEGDRNPAGGEEVHILEEDNPVVVVRNLAVADLRRFNKNNKLVSRSITCQFIMGSTDFPFWSNSHKKNPHIKHSFRSHFRCITAQVYCTLPGQVGCPAWTPVGGYGALISHNNLMLTAPTAAKQQIEYT